MREARKLLLATTILAVVTLQGIVSTKSEVPRSGTVSEIMAVGIDRKFVYEDGKRKALEPGHDEVLFYDLANPLQPLAIGSLTLENSIVGPPTNIAITPDQKIALIANSLHSEWTEAGWKFVPADELFVVDLEARPPKLISTVKVGRQPSGLAINKLGTLALLANRDSKSVTVLAIKGKTVAVTDTIEMSDGVGAVAISPDGRRAVATKALAHKASVLSIDEAGKVRVEQDLWVGLFPWNVAISTDGAVALVNNIGNAGQSDGNTDTVGVIDLAADPPRVSDYIAVGDAPEGIAISPQGDFAAVTLLNGSYDSPSSAWYRREDGRVALLGIKGQAIRTLDSIDVGSFPEGIAFSGDGQLIYVGNFHSGTLSILRVGSDGRLMDMHKDVKLPGPPASLRIGSR
jgi:DNA-binding beta-propeller fold protein YncE